MTAVAPDVPWVRPMATPVRERIADPPEDYSPRHAYVDKPRRTPLEWTRLFRTRTRPEPINTAHAKAAARLGTLGAGWTVLDARELGLETALDFVAIGPGGIFAVTVHQHGRSKVMFAGETAQIDGRRPPLVRQVRRDAHLISRGLTRMAGTPIPVVPVLAFHGTGKLEFFGVPKGCLITSHRGLASVLRARGQRISANTVAKLVAVATYRPTWRHVATVGAAG